MIIAECGEKTVLSLPTEKPLMDYFTSNTCENLTYVSGAVDPAKLILNVDGINFFPQIWRINSKHTSYNFKVKLGGYFASIWQSCDADTKGNKCSYEMAGFGLSDLQWGPSVYAIKSFGIRSTSDYAG